MTNITENDINEIRTIKSEIKALEVSLNRYMDSDLSSSIIRKEMREVLVTITEMETRLSTKLNSIK